MSSLYIIEYKKKFVVLEFGTMEILREIARH